MTTQHSRAVNQGVFLAFLQIKKPLFIIAAFRFPSLGVDFCHDSLNDVYLWKQRRKYGENEQTIHTNRSKGLSPEDHQHTPGSNSEILLPKLLFWEEGKINKCFLTYCIYLSIYTHTHRYIYTRIFICTHIQIVVLYIKLMLMHNFI